MSLTKEQLEFRRTGIGGSDVAAIAGKSKRRSPLDIYLSKIDEAYESPSTPHTHWGNRLESVIADEYEARESKKLLIPTEQYRSKKHPHMIATLDRLIDGENAAVEIKTTDKWLAMEWGDEGTDIIPDQYLLQVAHYRIVNNLDYIDIAVLIGGNDFRTYRYEKHSDLEHKVINIETNFWENHILKRVPPTPTTYKEAGSLWPVSDEKPFIANEEILNKLEEYKRIDDLVKDLLTKKEDAQTYICNLMKEASVLLSPAGQKLLTWKTYNSNRFDSKTFEKKYPELHKEFLKQRSYRRFDVKE